MEEHETSDKKVKAANGESAIVLEEEQDACNEVDGATDVKSESASEEERESSLLEVDRTTLGNECTVENTQAANATATRNKPCCTTSVTEGEEQQSLEPEVTIEEGEKSEGASCTCPHCELSFASTEALESHLVCCRAPAQKRRNKKLICDVCKESFTNAREFNMHKLLHMGASPVNHEVFGKGVLTPNGIQIYKTVVHTGQTLFACDQCPALFTSFLSLQQHAELHTGAKPSVKEVQATDSKSSPQMKTRQSKGKSKVEKTYNCDVCMETFKAYQELRVHKQTHGASKRHCCDVCGKCFQRSSKLSVHKRIHSNERPYRCDVCEATFIQLGNLNIHKRIHSGERPYQCDVCDAAFTQSSQLKVHKRGHTGERPYRCHLCDAAFAQLYGLILHRRSHTGERPFPCDACDLAFNSRGDLRVHQRRHTGERPFRCDVCSAAFTHLGTLNVHKRRHTGERRFLCDDCGAAFVTRGELNVHKRRHTGEQPYRCDACGAAFTQVASLNTHKRRHKAPAAT